VKVRCLKRKGGTLDTSEVLANFDQEGAPKRTDDLSERFFELEKNYLT